MKKFIKLLCVVAVCTLGFTQNGFAQQDDHVYLGYGIATAFDITDEFADIIITTGSGGTVTSTDSKYSGAIFAGYRTYVTDKLEVGGTFIFERAKKDLIVDSKNTGSVSMHSYGLLAEAKYNYINDERFKLHSGIGLGIAQSRVSTEENAKTDKEKMTDFAYQLDAIGVTFGDQFSVSLNAGFGYKGIANAVIAYGF